MGVHRFFNVLFLMAFQTSMASADDACTLRVGDKLVMDDLNVVLSEVASQAIEKDEFETTEEFEQRKAEALAATPRYFVLATSADQGQAVYDADKGAWFFTEYFPSNGSFTFVDELPFDRGVIEFRARDSAEALVVRSSDTLVSSYSATNAMGGSTTVGEWQHERVFVVEVTTKPVNGDRYGPNLFEYFDSVNLPNELSSGTRMHSAMKVEMPREIARSLKGKFGFAVAGVTVPPGYVEGPHFIKPTFDLPNERVIETKILLADIHCGAVFGPDQVVLAVLNPREPF